MALSGCDYFTNVVIPAQDTTAPLAVTGVYDLEQGKYVEIGLGGCPLEFDECPPAFQYTVTDPTLTVLAVGATYDTGGAKSVDLEVWFEYWCRDSKGKTEGPVFYETSGHQTATQTGRVGDTVSNGLWTYVPVRFDQYPSDPPNGCREFGLTTIGKAAELFVVSEDFFGNQAIQTGEIDYYGN